MKVKQVLVEITKTVVNKYDVIVKTSSSSNKEIIRQAYEQWQTRAYVSRSKKVIKYKVKRPTL